MLKKNKHTFELLVESLKIEARSKVEKVDIPKPTHGTDVTDWLRNTDRLPEILVKTGFEKLDETLKGGLTTGLHFLGAAPGTGKKTGVILQMCFTSSTKLSPITA